VTIVLFVRAVLTGTLIVQSDLRQSQRRLFALVTGLVVAIILVSQIRPPGNAVSIAALSFAMGVMNTTIARVGEQAVNIGFVSGTPNRFADHVALAV